MPPAREFLLNYLAVYSYKYNSESFVVLASGEVSTEYLDCKLAYGRPEGMLALGRVFHDMMSRDSVAIGGLTMGSDPIAMSVCQMSCGSAHPVRWFAVRKEPKIYGQQKLIEGSVATGDKVTIVDDVVTSGMSTIKAIRAVQNFGLIVGEVIVLVDREAGGMGAIQCAVGDDVPVRSVYTKSEIQAHWQKLSR